MENREVKAELRSTKANGFEAFAGFQHHMPYPYGAGKAVSVALREHRLLQWNAALYYVLFMYVPMSKLVNVFVTMGVWDRCVFDCCIFAGCPACSWIT